MAQDPYKYFRVEARELVDQLGKGLLDIEKSGASGELVSLMLRLAHTLKGAARVVKQPEIADHAHAIEGVLEPFRNKADNVAADTINGILGRLDDITSRLGMLSPSAAPAPEAARSKTPSDDGLRTLHTEVEEIDALVDGISETFTRLNSLRGMVGAVERAGQVGELLAAQVSARAGRGQLPAVSLRGDRVQSLAEELRAIIGGLERDLGPACDRMSRELHQIRDVAEQLRLVRAGTLFTSLERVARDAAQALGKSVTFAAEGGDVRLDAHVLRTIQEALTQIIRNAVAHGIEEAPTRGASSKPSAGRVSLQVARHGRRVIFRCEDDGRGVDLEAVRSAARRRGVAAKEIDKLGAGELVRLLLQGGLSTSASITEVSGRGIGMDIVREALDRLGGTVAVQTTPGRGTTFELMVPLSLAAVEALVVESGGISATIPLDSVRHTQRLKPGDISRSSQGESIVFDDKVIPFVPLARMLRGGATSRTSRDMSAVVVSGGAGLAAIGVDRLRGTANIVLRALPDLAPAEPVVAGASLDAEGNPQVVLDADGVISEALREAGAMVEDSAPEVPVLVIDDSLTTRMLQQSILESAGYLVDLAVSAEEALERARQKKYSLFLVDVEMPGMDGFTFVERIRADGALRSIPAILVTSLSSPESIERGKAAGAQGYMIKSEFDQSQLLALIRRLVA
jgi:two-component system, chemotaxis family, sensor kinase CheA